ncbi:coproporphyrinogen III oxidase family protein [Candidatus Woesearchaeota archaeon]|nr:coproporphyrinogen III oxidase family protein [Candidatus Woesearchaeota archaeon]
MTENKPSLEKIFEKGLELHHYANTAYPLDGRKVWKNYKVRPTDVNSEIKKQWQDVKELGLYVHIPFCDKRCAFCEYTVLSKEEAESKDKYLELLLKEIEFYRSFMENKTVVGLDIGGGTPTTLSAESLGKIIRASLQGYNLGPNFEISIETTPKIARMDFAKIKAIKDLGVERISMGIQTINPHLLEQIGRQHHTLKNLIDAKDNIRAAGFKKLNLDLMYGFANQSLDDFLSTVQFAIELEPEYVTLYRTRFKKTELASDVTKVSLEQTNQQYNSAYDLLIKNGYVANIGKNTFSKIAGDMGTSAYLTKRVVEGTPYLGMGLGAQSLAKDAMYYNQGAASKKLNRYEEMVNEGSFPIQDLYVLPPEEIMAKFICVSFYFGGINEQAFQEKFGMSLGDKFREELLFLEDRGLMKHQNGLFCLTEKGNNVVNGIIPLFYSNTSRENLMIRRPD